MPATDYLIMNVAKYPDDIAVVEVNPAIRDERGKTWRDYELVETPASQRYRREITWRAFNDQANRSGLILASICAFALAGANFDSGTALGCTAHPLGAT